MSLPNFNEYVSSGPPQINQFNAYGGNAPPFKFNNTYDINGSNEANLANNIYSEYTYLYGSDIIFLPRSINKEETSFGEYLAATIEKGYPIRLFIEEVQAWSGNGDMYSKFGLQVTDECTLFCNKLTFNQATSSIDYPSGIYPKQSDLIYIVKSQKLFMISHIEDEISPAFYLLGNRAGYKIQCKLFSYTHEKVDQSPDNGIPEAIKALDGLLGNINNPGVSATLPDKDFFNNNQNIQNSAISLIDTSEQDPLG